MKLDVSPVGSGSIALNGDIVESYPADSKFYGRISATLEAMPVPGYYFANWSSDLAGTENPVSLDILHDSLITANFSPIVHTISLEVDGNGSTEPAVGTHEYNEGDVVRITAIPDKGCQFDGWSGDVTDPELTTTTFVVTSDKTVTANFSPIVHTVSLEVDGNGSTEPAAGTHEYDKGDVVRITAIPGEGWQFDGWSGDVTDPELTTTTLIVTSDKTVTADFSLVVYTISLEVDGNGSTEPAAGTHEYDKGDVVSITAIPGEGWQFDGWSGDVTDPQLAMTTLIVTSDKTVTADFSLVEPDWWRVLRTLYDKVLAMLRQLGN